MAADSILPIAILIINTAKRREKNVQEGEERGSMGEPQIWGPLMSLFGVQLCVCLWCLKSIKNMLGVRASLWLQRLGEDRVAHPQTHFLRRAGTVRQSGSKRTDAWRALKRQRYCPTCCKESNTLWLAWKKIFLGDADYRWVIVLVAWWNWMLEVSPLKLKSALKGCLLCCIIGWQQSSNKVQF